MKLLPVAGNEQKLCTEELFLFRKYQTVIHNDDEPTATEFEEFLINSPLEVHYPNKCVYWGSGWSFIRLFYLEEDCKVLVGMLR